MRPTIDFRIKSDANSERQVFHLEDESAYQAIVQPVAASLLSLYLPFDTQIEFLRNIKDHAGTLPRGAVFVLDNVGKKYPNGDLDLLATDTIERLLFENIEIDRIIVFSHEWVKPKLYEPVAFVSKDNHSKLRSELYKIFTKYAPL